MGIRLSKRLETIVNHVEKGCVPVDVGTDHAHVPIRLLQDGIVNKVYGFDVADGPLEIARTNLELAGLESACEIRKSDGLAAYEIGEADTLIVAGMGGILMKSILEEYPEKTESFQTMILSPQSEPWLVRDSLRTNGIGIVQEDFIEEDGKYYAIILAKPGEEGKKPAWDELADRAESLGSTDQFGINPIAAAVMMRDTEFQKLAENEFGPCILSAGGEVFTSFIKWQLRGKIEIYQKLIEVEADDVRDPAAMKRRLDELQSQIGMLQIILFMQEILLK